MVSLTADHGLEPYYRRELLAHWRAAGTSRRNRGRAWYGTARTMMQALAADTGYSVEQAVAVLAITSPGAQIVTNVEWTRRALETHGAARVGRFPNSMAPKIRAVLDSPEAAHEYVTGPKVGAFHRAILGDSSQLVLDRWAVHAAQGSTDGSAREGNHKMRQLVRAAIEQAYRNAARSVRANVAAFQASVWIHVRETTPIYRRGQWVTVRFADITSA